MGLIFQSNKCIKKPLTHNSTLARKDLSNEIRQQNQLLRNWLGLKYSKYKIYKENESTCISVTNETSVEM